MSDLEPDFPLVYTSFGLASLTLECRNDGPLGDPDVGRRSSKCHWGIIERQVVLPADADH